MENNSQIIIYQTESGLTKIDVRLEPMPADERRVVHNALTGMPNIKTESVGEGHRRAICIRYVA